MTERRRFRHVAGAGAAFQAGSSAVDSATVMSALVFQLTGSPVAVGAVSTILRLGWLLPQLIVGFLAGKGGSAMPFYAVGAFGRTGAIALLAAILWFGQVMGWPPAALGAATLVLWTLYAFLSGIVGVPYNDIVARSIPSNLRSRVLALRFFGGGVAGLGVAALADRLIRSLDFPTSYAAVFAVAAALMLISSALFVAMGEPNRMPLARKADTFTTYLREGIVTYRTDGTFRRFVISQWCGGAVLMAAPFFIVGTESLGVGLQNVALLLAAQTAGALLSNPLWGWWGDRLGKLSLMRAIAVARVFPPVLLVALLAADVPGSRALPVLLGVFVVLGALTNGLTIAVIGLLMEISPEDCRPAYSGYFNALSAPAYLLPLVGGGVAAAFGLELVFAISAAAALGQIAILAAINLQNEEDRRKTLW